MQRLFLFFLFLLIISVSLILIPNWSFKFASTRGKWTLYSNRTLPKSANHVLATVDSLLRKSELYDSQRKYNLYEAEKSWYQSLITPIFGEAFGFGRFNDVIILGKVDWEANTTEIRGYKWRLSHLIAHEAMHGLQETRLGLWNANPLKHPEMWKYEGYPEFIARQKAFPDFRTNVQRAKEEWIDWGDGTGAPRTYYEAFLICQYLIQEKHFTFDELQRETRSEDFLLKEALSHGLFLPIKQ